MTDASLGRDTTPTVSRPEPHFPGRGAAVAVVTLLLGPPIGSLVVTGFLFSGVFLTPVPDGGLGSQPDVVEAGVTFALLSALYSYIFGGVQALASGIWLGYRTWRVGTFTRREALIAALVVSVVSGSALFAMDTQGLGAIRDNLITIGFLALCGVVGILGVRRLLVTFGVIAA